MTPTERDTRIVALARQRTPPASIAADLGCPVETVYSAITRARRAGAAIPHFPRTRQQRPAERNARTVVVPVDILDRLQPHAAARSVTVNRLIRNLLEEVTDANLVDAILDDGQ